MIAASASFCAAFEIDPTTNTDRPFAMLGAGEWKIPQLTSLLKATATGLAEIKGYEVDLIRVGGEPRRLVSMATSSMKSVLVLPLGKYGKCSRNIAHDRSAMFGNKIAGAAAEELGPR